MNDKPDEFDDLEALLRQMPLKRPTAQLDQRVTDAIRSTRPRRDRRWMIGVLGAMAAAAMVTIVLVPWNGTTDTPAQPQPASMIAHVETTEAMAQWQDDGIVDYTPEGPIRQYVVTTVQQFASADGEGYLVHESLVQIVSQVY